MISYDDCRAVGNAAKTSLRKDRRLGSSWVLYTNVERDPWAERTTLDVLSNPRTVFETVGSLRLSFSHYIGKVRIPPPSATIQFASKYLVQLLLPDKRARVGSLGV